MERSVFETQEKIESVHWWYVGRRKLFCSVIDKIGLKEDDFITELGLGCGGTIAALKEKNFLNLSGVDISDRAVEFCHKRGLTRVVKGNIERTGFKGQSQNLVIATDVLEHVDDDTAALEEINRILIKDGYALITVPAFMCLWSYQDEVYHHKRRYIIKDIIKKSKIAGFKIEKSFYFNFILFFPIFCLRNLFKFLKVRNENENLYTPGLINLFFKWIFELDIFISSRVSIPFGVSCFILLKKDGNP